MSMVYASEIVSTLEDFNNLPETIQAQVLRELEKIDIALEAAYPSILQISRNFYEKRFFDYDTLIGELKKYHIENYCELVNTIISGKEESGTVSNSCGRICLTSNLQYSPGEGITSEFNISYDIMSVFGTIKTEE